jgi:hypothetical protein
VEDGQPTIVSALFSHHQRLQNPDHMILVAGYNGCYTPT